MQEKKCLQEDGNTQKSCLQQKPHIKIMFACENFSHAKKRMVRHVKDLLNFLVGLFTRSIILRYWTIQ